MNPRLRCFPRLPPFRGVRPRIRNLHSEPPRPAAQAGKSPQSRFDRLISRLPRFTHRYLVPLRHAPLTHISAFLLLHELTAVVPLFGFAAFFHYTNWLPAWFAEGYLVKEGVERFGKWLRKKGWLGEGELEEARELERERERESHRGEQPRGVTAREKWWGRGEGGVRIVVELATSYAIVKALLIPRIILSAWATPWFARVSIIPATNLVRRMFGRAPKSVAGSTSSGAGTGAVSGGAVPKK